MALALRVSHLTHRYADTTALHDVSLAVSAGSMLALVGESGSGKTTLLRTFNRTVEPARGSVFVGDDDVTTLDVVGLRRRVGYVPQSGGLLPHWTVERNVALVPSLNGNANPGLAAARALDVCGLAPNAFAHRYPHELSGGQRQRVAIARALAGEQQVVLLDEAFGALDAISRSDLLDAFASIHAALGFTAVLVTHDLGEAIRLADAIAVMRVGRIEQIGVVRDLIDRPSTSGGTSELERLRGVHQQSQRTGGRTWRAVAIRSGVGVRVSRWQRDRDVCWRPGYRRRPQRSATIRYCVVRWEQRGRSRRGECRRLIELGRQTGATHGGRNAPSGREATQRIWSVRHVGERVGVVRGLAR